MVATCAYSEDLARLIIKEYREQKFTFVSGTIRHTILPQILKEQGVVYQEFHVYNTTLTPLAITQKMDAVLFYSPSGVKSYLQENSVSNEVCFCIGKTTASALNGITTNIKIASQPTIEDTVEACITYFA